MSKQRNQIIKNNKQSMVASIAVLIVTFLILAGGLLALYSKILSTTNILVMLGSMVLLLVSTAIYLFYTDVSNVLNVRKMLSMCTMIVVSLALLLLFDKVFDLVPLAPLALCALTMALLVSNHCGFVANFCVILLYFIQSVVFGGNSGVIAENSFYTLFAGLMVTVFAVFVMGKQYKRLTYIVVGVLLGAISAICRLISYFMFTNDLGWKYLLIECAYSLGSGVVTIMLMFILLPLVERLFNVVSPFRFAEIATSNNSIMKELFEKAPGTYNHSLTVANYVEACASAIGLSTFLARTVAYYHDIGKMKSPNYFTENLALNEHNPHDNLIPEASVAIIKGHTAYGLQLAKENQLPIEVQRAIVEHHGTMPIKYFYLKAKKYTDGELPYDDYMYDGPRPTSKISAVLMICDASEAALRAVGDNSKAEEIVDGIVAERMRFDQFAKCDITMKEIDTIKSTIITTFLGIKHHRVKYPNVKLEDK